MKRRLSAESPNQLWVADFTYVTTHQGFVYTAFVIDVFARRIVGWKVSKRMDTDMVMDALAQALYARCPKGVIHHSDRGSQYLSIGYTERLRQAQMKASVGTKGDSYDNAPAQTINGLYKAEVIHPNGLGGGWLMWSGRDWNGWIGLITTVYWSRLAMCHRLSMKWRIIANWKSRLRRLDSR
ncbi:IS3 family transposase [Paralysiella testudinis]|uniref:IS3 family transposase n=1 Tax=Paralysiella testudinis TaxID=2809020 RepID=A0A892ZCZ7_9NEIS|nr:IS3 family transposase [Paralysiella testudinis]